MISADCHAQEPANLWAERIDKKFRDRLPRVEVDENGVKWSISEGWARSRLLDSSLTGEDLYRNSRGYDPAAAARSRARRHRCGNHFPEQGTHDVGDLRRRVRARAMQDLERLGVGDLRQVQRSHVADGRDRDRRRDRRPPKSSASRNWDFAASRCHANRSSARMTRVIPTTTCGCSIRCGRRSRTPTCRSPSTSRPDAIRARRAKTAAR